MTSGNASIEDATTDAAADRLEAAPRTRLGVLQRDGFGALGVLVLVLILSVAFVSDFRSGNNVRDVLIQASFPALIAIGMTLTIITGGIDLSVGSVYALSAVLVTKMVDPTQGYGQNIVLGLVVALGAALAVGFIQGLLISRTQMPPFIITLAGLYGVRGVAIFVTQEGALTYSTPSTSAFYHFGTGHWLWVNNVVLVATLVSVIGYYVLNRTSFGLTIFAIGGNENASNLMGLKVSRTKLLTYMTSAGLAGLAGVLSAAYAQSGIPNGGVGYELDAIAAVVIGGTLLTGGKGSLIGTVSGVLLLTVVRTLINLGAFGHLPSATQQVVTGAFVIIVVLLQVYLTRSQRR